MGLVKSAGGIIYRNASNSVFVYVVSHSNYGFVFPKGRINDGESIEDAAIREVREETGFVVTKPKFSLESIFYTFTKDGKIFDKVVYFFAFEVLKEFPDQPTSLDNGEKIIDGSKWLSIEEAQSSLAHESEKDRLKEFAVKLKYKL